MKKMAFAMLTLLTCGAMQALPVGNPKEASLFTKGIYCESGCTDWCDPCFNWYEAWNVRVGFYGNYVYNRHLEVDGGPANRAQVDHASIFTNAGYMTLNICDRFDIFATLGATNIALATDARIFFSDIDPFRSYIVWQPTFSWSVGGRVTLWECNCFAVGLEGEYLQTSPKLDYSEINNIVTSQDEYSTKYREWQVGLGAAYTIATNCPRLALVPYVAVAVSGCHMNSSLFAFPASDDANIVTTLPGFIHDKSWGYAIGTTFTLCDVAGVTVEGRFGAEKALYVNGQLRF